MLRLAVDVGGTFTDVVAVDSESGHIEVLKVSSTPLRPETGFLEGVAEVLARIGAGGEDVEMVIHVGTIGTNLFRGQLGLEIPKVALVTTKGFKDVLEIGRQNRPRLYDLFYERPRPLVERKHRYEVNERVDAEGNVLLKPTEEELNELVKELRGHAFASIAISFINSYLNPANEVYVKKFLTDLLNVRVYISSEVDPEHREYERTSTTVVNAVLAPVVSRYMESVIRGLRDMEVNSPLLIMSSAGGLVDVEEVIERPITAIESGPAAGVVAAATFSELLEIKKLVSLDMGGTTAKAGTVINHSPLMVQEVEVGGEVHMGRSVKGSGYPVRYPSIDLAEVSAGGGSIVWVDEGGTLRVGPVSSGSDPGPACYGRGGQDPTITDANLLLGRLSDSLIGGGMRLKRELAERVFKTVAQKLYYDGSVEDAASLAIKVVNLLMGRAVKIVSLERGLDPRDFTLMVFGGAGPMHAAELAETLEIRRIIIPPYAEVFSALGLLLTDVKYSFVSGMLRPLSSLRMEEVESAYRRLEELALERVKQRMNDGQISLIRTADLRYLGQGYEIELPVQRPLTEEGRPKLIEDFETRHEVMYGFKHSGDEVEITALRVYAIVQVKKPSITPLRKEGDSLLGVREAYFNKGFVETEVHEWSKLSPNSLIQGPAIIESYGSTVVIPPGWRASIDERSCIVMER